MELQFNSKPNKMQPVLCFSDYGFSYEEYYRKRPSNPRKLELYRRREQRGYAITEGYGLGHGRLITPTIQG
jgi:hypothetical protein